MLTSLSLDCSLMILIIHTENSLFIKDISNIGRVFNQDPKDKSNVIRSFTFAGLVVGQKQFVKGSLTQSVTVC